MNGLRAQTAELDAVIDGARSAAADVLICPPMTLLATFAEIAHGTTVSVGAQDCHWAASGAHTGDVSAEMIADAGAKYVILGHSERRADHGESDADVLAKMGAARRAGLAPVVCVGESEAERDANRAEEVVAAQIDGSIPEQIGETGLVIAYEPVWAIGTGRTPTTEEIAAMHAFIRARLANRFGAEAAVAIRVLYGGSVKPGNAAEIFALENVDGGLIGGASLKAADFLAVIEAAA